MMTDASISVASVSVKPKLAIVKVCSPSGAILTALSAPAGGALARIDPISGNTADVIFSSSPPRSVKLKSTVKLRPASEVISL